MKKIIVILLIPTFMLSIFTGCGSKEELNSNVSKKQLNTIEEKKEGAKNTLTEVQAPIQRVDEVNMLLKNMTLEQKVGQVFIMSLRNFSQYPRVIEINKAVKKRIHDNHLGGIILFAENIETIPQTKKLIEDLNAASGIPLFMAIDEEGGATSRINKSEKMHATRLPSNYTLGRADDAELTKKVGALIAKEIYSLGFNMDFAPVADVNTNPNNPVIGDRSFGDNPKLVAKMVIAEMMGFQENGVITVLKHFPGHGDTSLDTHTGAVSIQHDRTRLNKVELFPFQAGIDNGAEAIMTAHIQVPQITGNEMPATLSRKILTDLLRGEMKFEGIIITDALEMGAISQRWGSAEASILAFEAGADMILMPASIDDAYQGLLNVIKQGRISEKRLNESVERILKLKKKWGILDNNIRDMDPDKVLGCKEHRELVKEIEEKGNLKD